VGEQWKSQSLLRTGQAQEVVTRTLEGLSGAPGRPAQKLIYLGLHACKACALPLEPCFLSVLLWLFW
jgi:hypothetical protein